MQSKLAIASVFVLIASVCYGRRLQHQADQWQSERAVIEGGNHSRARERIRGTLKPASVLATLLLRPDLVAAFNLHSLRPRHRIVNTILAGSHQELMNAQVFAAKPLVREWVGLQNSLQTGAVQRRAAPVSMKTREAWVADLGDEAHGTEAGGAIYEFFSSLASSAEFVNDCWAKKPVLYRSIAGVADSFTLDHLQVAVDSDFLEAARGIPDMGGWKMVPVAPPRGPSFEDAKMRYIDVAEAMKHGTVIFNSAGAAVPRLGTASLAAIDAFKLPNGLNLYVTAKGTKKSAPPHTDKQDVFVLQSTGAKRWRVFGPPPPKRKPDADPLARGKQHDILEFSELSEPVIDCVLSPGDVLYVPAGFPHTTDTVNTAEAGDAADADSIHLTIGIDTHIWGLDYASLRTGALDHAKMPDKRNVRALPAESYWRLMRVPSTLGFLKDHAATDSQDALQPSSLASELIACTKLAEPKRWAEQSDSELAEALGVVEVEAQIERHADRMLQAHRDMYLDAARDVIPPGPPGSPRVSTFRVQAHMAKLEVAMEEHLEWYGPVAVKRVKDAAALERSLASMAGSSLQGKGNDNTETADPRKRAAKSKRTKTKKRR